MIFGHTGVMLLIEIKGLTKVYGKGGAKVDALDGIDLKVEINKVADGDIRKRVAELLNYANFA
jgi:hypothetical protein